MFTSLALGLAAKWEEPRAPLVSANSRKEDGEPEEELHVQNCLPRVEGSRALEKVGCCEQTALKLLATHRATVSALLDIIHRRHFSHSTDRKLKPQTKAVGKSFRELEAKTRVKIAIRN